MSRDPNYNPGMTPMSAAMFHQQTVASATPTNVFKVNNIPEDDRDKVRTDNFPVQLGSSDPEDTKWALHKKVLGNSTTGVIPGVGQVIAGPEYFDYTKRKMEMAEEVAFRDWLIKQASFNTPEESEYWFRTFPWIPELKFNEVNRVSELQKTQARINITGPQTPEDWKHVYNVARGIIQIPTQPVHLLPLDKNSYPNKNYYERGLFSPMVNFIPPYNQQKTAGEPAYQPKFQFDWTNPMRMSKPFENRTMLVPNTTSVAQYGQPPVNQV